jgi:putative NIF3 family GTP cyclohydrolase 1 type 2
MAREDGATRLQAQVRLARNAAGGDYSRMKYIAVLMIIALPLSAQNAPTAASVINTIRERSATQVKTPTIDTFKTGDSTARVTGIAVTMMATLDVLKRAAEKGDNLIITHEPTFYSHRDTTGALESENDQVLAAKRKFIDDHKLIIWRFHDLPHAMRPDMINAGIVKSLGWQKFARDSTSNVFELPRATVASLSKQLAAKLDARAIRISGDENATVSRVVMTQGFWGFPSIRRIIQRSNPEVVVIGEDHEWETIEYVVDAISAGQIKALIVLGHIPSEQQGMLEFSRWLQPLFPSVRIDFVATHDPFRPLR